MPRVGRGYIYPHIHINEVGVSMVKALASKIFLSRQDTDIAVEYYREVEDLLFSPEVLRLAGCQQHMDFNRLQHSVNVSYYSFLLCRRLRLNARAAARGGLLHDLFYYDWRKSGTGHRHVSLHPQVALENAENLAELTDVERDIIAKHMWPLSGVPQYRESFIVSVVDKLCAVMEAVASVHRTVSDNTRLY